jgi:aminodeoxyfutalosine synthase
MKRNYKDLLERVEQGKRIDHDLALDLFKKPTPDSLYYLGEAANISRKFRHGSRATYVNNLQVNPSNICVRTCSFCDYAALPGRTGRYSLNEDEIFANISRAKPNEVHIVGGLNHDWNYGRSLELVREVRRRFSDIHIKAYTAVEIHWFATLEKRSVNEILIELQEAGMDALPGGGAEIFSGRMREKHFKSKIGASDWLAVHEAAHKLGIPSNSTMLYGLGETWEERISHLLQLRTLQDQTNGFVSFIPLALQFGKDSDKSLSPLENLTVIAMSRLLLDNIPHIKAYWPMIGTEAAAAALSYGADDLDGTLGLERIAHASGAKTPTELAKYEMEKLISLAGYEPVERDGQYQSINDQKLQSLAIEA